MLSKAISGAVIGIDGYLVDVEVDLAHGIPAFDIVGLPDSAVKESRDRVRTAIRNTGFKFPVNRITVNLAPADIRKSGPAFDLPIAIGILIGTKMIPDTASQESFFTGELSLDGAVRPVAGVLPMILAARDAGLTSCFVPEANAEEAALVDGVTVYPVTNIIQLVNHFGGEPITPVSVDIQAIFRENAATHLADFADVKGQMGVKRALEVAAAGYHNLLMVGPPGAGKTMLATRMPTIMPDLDFEESLEITKIYSIAGLLGNKCQLITNRPFRAPHHTASFMSLAGGGRVPKPGEISLAHNGVLFLDELTEFQKKALEILRQPLEDGKITVSRASGVCTYPSAFLLLASMNPCSCGYYGTAKCRCSQHEVDRYLSRVSGPLLDRLDIQCEVVSVDYDALSGAPAETSQEIRKRVLQARKCQEIRFKNEPVKVNAHMTAPLIDKYCMLGANEKTLLQQAFDRMNLSARAYHKILKISRTIADLAGEENINVMHITEAISYRGLDRKYW
ncbi:MAG: YifB family Mg chelatase-like AAA ATPase [Defluviitaleaceae bacterium]|nr:YifB family Mg chelatase-like AAA ATPase [Defluviitaleaceae bacterium]